MTNQSKKNINKKNNKTRKNLHKERIVFESFEDDYEKKVNESIKKKNKKYLSHVEKLLDESRVAIYKKQNSGDLWQAPLVKLFQVPFTPSNIKPNNDYYTYVNFRWLQNTENEFDSKGKPKNRKYFSQIDNFRLVQDKTYRDVLNLVNEYVKKNHSRKATLINNVKKSFQSLNNFSNTKKHITEFTNMYNSLVKKNDLWEFLAEINKNEIISWGSPITWKVMADQKDAKTYRSFISSPQLSIFDIKVYFNDTTGLTAEEIKYKNILKSKYLKYINDIFEACLGKNHGLSAKDVFDKEVEIVYAMGCSSVKNDSTEFYNIVKKDESLKKYSFDWEKFSKCLGYTHTPDFFICGGLNYLKCMCDNLTPNWTDEKWKSYWYYIFLRQLIRFDRKLNEIHYEFKGKYITGLPTNFPYDLYPVFGLSITFNTFLAEEYINAYENDEIIQYVSNMFHDLIKVFKRIIIRNDWLNPNTKKNALTKLDHLKLVIGRPAVLREDPLLNYIANDPWVNMMLITKWRHEKFIKLDGCRVVDIPMIDWANTPFKLTGYQPYIVNAFYTPTMNNIYIPYAYLQKPFIDLQERGIEYNLVHVGYTLGHEMSHCLDSTGSKYDYKGNLHNWWTDSDRKHYNSILEDIIKQYEAFALKDGIKFDAKPSIGEDVADISGLAICEEYLKDFQDHNDYIVPIRALSFETFYVYFAVQQRQHIYKSALRAQLLTNPHPLDKYRTNVPLSRLEIFRNIYNVKKGDGMYWPDMRTVF
jgi:predicted metalloendopeptidase